MTTPLSEFSLGTRAVGPAHPCLVVAEVAQAHDGSLGTAHAYIDVAAKAGADAVKFQTHIAEAESTPSEPWRVKFSPQDTSRFEELGLWRGVRGARFRNSIRFGNSLGSGRGGRDL
jgi:hypothetical protein